MSKIEEWAIREYDRIIADKAGEDGFPLPETAKEFQNRYVKALEENKIQRPQPDDWQEALDLFNRTVKPARNRRSRKLTNDMEYILSALNDETILGRDDPIFSQAHRLGTSDGRDKILGTWSIEDWRNVALVRYDNAAEAVAGAARFNQLQKEIVDAMRRRGAAHVWDLFSNGD